MFLSFSRYVLGYNCVSVFYSSCSGAPAARTAKWSTVTMVREPHASSKPGDSFFMVYMASSMYRRREYPTTNQSGYVPLNMENGWFLNSDNVDATDLRF